MPRPCAPQQQPDRFGSYPALACAAIAGLTLLVYARTCGFGFIWDDAAHVTAPDLRSLGGLLRIWTEPGATQQYYPLLHGFFWLQFHLWGDAPAGYHAVNVLLHAGNACLLAAVVARLFAPVTGPTARPAPAGWPPVAILAGLIFALHPVYVESIAWISEQKNTFSMIFYLAAAYCYLGFDRTRGRRPYVLATTWFAAAILAKSLTATLPAALLVVFWWQRGRLEWRRDVQPLLPWFAAGAAIGVFTGWVERHYIGAEGEVFNLTLVERGLLAGRVVWFYLGKYVWPAELIFIYPRWSVDAAQGWQWLFPAAAVALAAGLWLLRHRHRGPLAAYLFFVGSMVPTIGFFNVYAFQFSYVADHWNYLPGAGLAVALAAAMVALGRRMQPAVRPWGLGGAAAILVALALLSWRQSSGYREVGVFYRTILAANPDCWLAHNNLGNLLAADAPEESAAHFREALRLRPGYVEAEFNWGIMLNRHDRLPEAIPHFEAAARMGRGFAPAEHELGVAYAKLGRQEEAVAHNRAALRLRPGYAETRANLGISLAALAQYDEAVLQLRQAAQERPGSPDIHYYLALVLAAAGRPGEAIAPFETAIRLRPEHSPTRFQFAMALFQAGREAEAMAQNKVGQQLRAAGK
jgi:tetratricopeptide (TPR) repeat protein